MENRNALVEGDIGIIYTDGTVEKGATSQGFVFKSIQAFDTAEDICYIPELCGDIIQELYQGNKSDFTSADYATCYTKEDFLDLAGNNEKLARYIFNMIDLATSKYLCRGNR